jgi:hypothetical protein
MSRPVLRSCICQWMSVPIITRDVCSVSQWHCCTSTGSTRLWMWWLLNVLLNTPWRFVPLHLPQNKYYKYTIIKSSLHTKIVDLQTSLRVFYCYKILFRTRYYYCYYCYFNLIINNFNLTWILQVNNYNHKYAGAITFKRLVSLGTKFKRLWFKTTYSTLLIALINARVEEIFCTFSHLVA